MQKGSIGPGVRRNIDDLRSICLRQVKCPRQSMLVVQRTRQRLPGGVTGVQVRELRRDHNTSLADAIKEAVHQILWPPVQVLIRHPTAVESPPEFGRLIYQYLRSV